MSGLLTNHPDYQSTMARLEALKRTTTQDSEYWLARDIHPILGYPTWARFEPVIERAMQAIATNGLEPEDHFAQTSKMVELGSGSMRRVGDYYLSRPACYLIAMNGDPSKPEIAAAQAYFAIQTRRMELEDASSEDEKRVKLRGKVKQSFKRVSGVAQDAGVRSHMQGIFHDARYQGLYGMPLKDLKKLKGLRDGENIFDRAGPLELSANDFQMSLAADVISKENIRGEQRVIQKNKELAQRVRRTIADSGATMPERLPLEPPIKEIEKRLKKLPGPSGSSNA